MDQIPGFVRGLIALVIVAISAIIAQRKWGSKWLLWVWIASVVIITGATLFWGFYKSGFPLPSTRQELFALAIVSLWLFMTVSLTVGMLIWGIASFGPRPPQASLSEINYFPFNLPMRELEDTLSLTGILQRYHALLTTFATALDRALASTLGHPYQPVLHGFYRSFRIYSPS